MMAARQNRPLIAAGTMIGIGLGGFVDGILFHQLLQLHNMLSARFPISDVQDAQRLVVNLEINMFWDGLFHAVCWFITVAGILMLWNAARKPEVSLRTQTFMGSMLIGWGLFNLVEGVIDHHLLHVHHVIETEGHLVWDIAFLASGILLVVLGWLMVRSSERRGALLVRSG